MRHRRWTRALEQALALQPPAIVGIDNDESEPCFLQDAYRDDERGNLHLANIHDPGDLATLMAHAEIMLHAAA